MAKKSNYGWVFTGDTPAGRTQKPTDSVKRKVDALMQPFIQILKDENLQPIPEPQQFNHLVDIYGKWNRNFYYIYQTYKCTPEGSTRDKFDVGFARMRYVGNEKFDLAYFRHTGQWWDLPQSTGLTTEEAIESIHTDPWFQMF